jgi:hypothetical protein
LGLLGILLRREPEQYRNIAVPEGEARKHLSKLFASHAQDLITIGLSADELWSEEFSADQINSYFAEDFIRVKPFKLPDGINSPRIAIEPGRLRFGFRYGTGWFSSVITVDLNCWLPATETNVVAIELLEIHAGALPFSMQSVLEQMADNARRWNLDVNWYRHANHPVALVRIQPDRPNPTILLQHLELKDGSIVIGGTSNRGASIFSFGD